MMHDELFGKYLRLQRELVQAYTDIGRRDGQIERITDEMAELRKALARGQPYDEQTEDPIPGV
jgi:hypothetical protein